MPIFFFNIRNGRDYPDNVGEELPDWDAAREHAVKSAGKILDNEATRIALGQDWCMEVADDAGAVLFRFDFHLNAVPLASRNRAR